MNFGSAGFQLDWIGRRLQQSDKVGLTGYFLMTDWFLFLTLSLTVERRLLLLLLLLEEAFDTTDWFLGFDPPPPLDANRCFALSAAAIWPPAAALIGGAYWEEENKETGKLVDTG